jgi:excisionase family DNA binding protein
MMDNGQTGRLLTADQVADRWQVPRAHIYRLSRQGRLPCVEIGRYRRWSLDAVEEFERSGGTNGKATEAPDREARG